MYRCIRESCVAYELLPKTPWFMVLMNTWWVMHLDNGDSRAVARSSIGSRRYDELSIAWPVPKVAGG